MPAPCTVHLICGFLGVGKTTTLRWILDQRPEGARWAVLVNEFGEIGIDGALLAEGGGVAIKELANGCICCSAGIGLHQALVRLVRDHAPERLFIEPTGLASPARIVDLLRSPGFAGRIRLAPVITLVDPTHWESPRHRAHDPWQDQIEVAEVILASRTDLATPAQTERLLREARALFPPKRHVGVVEGGVFDLGLLGVPAEAAGPTPPTALRIFAYRDEPAPGLELDAAARAAQQPPAPPEVAAAGWRFPPEVIFSLDAIEAWVQATAVALQLDRLKGIFQTDQGWWAVNATARQIAWEGVQWRQDSRVELLAPPPAPADWDAVRAAVGAALAACQVVLEG